MFSRHVSIKYTTRTAPTDCLRAPVQSPGGGGIRDRRPLRGIRHDVFRYASPTIQAGILEVNKIFLVAVVAKEGGGGIVGCNGALSDGNYWNIGNVARCREG
jgi:hypothetical protein